jgi:hypothetical protein
MNETLRNRITRERNERKAFSDLREFARQSNERNQSNSAARLINTERRDEINTKVRQVLAPVIPKEIPRPAPVETNAVLGTAPEMGAFYGFYTVPDGAGAGDIYLQGGTIGGEAVATLDLKLYDASSDAWEGTMDEHLYVTAAGDGVVEDLVLLPGFVVSAITGPLIGTPPADSLPTALDASGACRISLGVFTGSGFMPAAIGNRSITFCPGGAFIVTP